MRETLRHVDVFFPNAREAQKISGCEDLQAAISRLSEMVPLLVVKLGEEGALVRRGREQVTSPRIPVDFVDPVGAGDSFDAGFIHQYVRGADLATCLAWGNRAGGFSTTRPGGTEAFRDRKHLDSFFPTQP